MKKLIIFLIMPFMMFGCHVDNDDGRIKVYTSFYTMYDLTQKIAGETAAVYNLIPNGGDAHHWEPSTKDIVSLNKADIFIYNGLGMEHWVEAVLPTLQNSKLLAVKASDEVEVLGEHEHDDHDHEGADPHIWLAPKNAKIILSNIKNAFIEADPDNALEYQSNYDKYAPECDKLDNEYKDRLKSFTQHRDIVVTHQAFSYLCEEYNLNQIALLGVHSQELDSIRKVQVMNEIENKHIKVVFYESASGKRLAQSIKDDVTSIEIAPLNPLESLTESEIASEADYFSVMRTNLAAIFNALEKQNGVN